MNKNINLCEILKGCEGTELYSPLCGKCTFDIIIDNEFGYHIKCFYIDSDKNKFYLLFSDSGKFLKEANGECLLFPSKEQRDWSKFEKLIPIDTPMMCSDNTENWCLRYFSQKTNGVFPDGLKSNEGIHEIHYDYMIPYDKFNPDNIEESLKYNIQK